MTVAIRFAPGLYQTTALVLCAYLLMFLPPRVGESAVRPGPDPARTGGGIAVAGRSPAHTFFHVTLRLTAPAAAAGMCLVFVAVATELTATLLLAPPTGTRTLAMRFWSLSSELDYAAAAPYATVLVLLSIPVTVLLFNQSTKVATA